MTTPSRETVAVKPPARDATGRLSWLSGFALGRMMRSLGLGGVIGLALGAVVHQHWPSVFPDVQIASYVGAGIGILLHRFLDLLVEWFLAPIGKVLWLWIRILNLLTMKRAGVLRADMVGTLIEHLVVESANIDPKTSRLLGTLQRQGGSGGALSAPALDQGQKPHRVLPTGNASATSGDPAKGQSAKGPPRRQQKARSATDGATATPALLPARVSEEDAQGTVAAELEAAEAEAARADKILGTRKIMG